MALTITIPGAVEATIGATAPAVLTIGVGTPGATGPQGPQGIQGPQGPQGEPGEPGQGVPAGGLASQVLAKIDGQDFNTEWVDQSGAVVWGGIGGEISNQGDLVSALADKLDITTAAATYYLQTNPNGFITVSALTGYATQSWVTAGFYPLSGNPSGFLTASALTPYLSKAGNLSGLTSLSTARDNLNLGTSNIPVFAGVTAQGAGGNVAQLSPTSLSLTQTGSGIFTIQPSQGIVFPDATVQTTAYPGPVGATQWGSIGGSLINQTDLYNSLAAKLDSTTAASTYAVIAAGQPVAGTTGQVLTKQSGANWDSAWATLIPGDRYLTSSTTSNTLSNTTKTFTIGTGLSYTPTQSITISYDAGNHMHGEVLTYNSGTGVLTVDINHHTGSGTYAAWVVNVGGVVPATSVAWGAITGVIGNQSDLSGELAAKLDVTTAASTYFTIASAAGKANLASPVFSGTPSLPTGTTAVTQSVGNNTTAVATTAFVIANAGGGGGGYTPKTVLEVQTDGRTITSPDFGKVLYFTSPSNGIIYLPIAPPGSQVLISFTQEDCKQVEGALGVTVYGANVNDRLIHYNSGLVTMTCVNSDNTTNAVWRADNPLLFTTSWPPAGTVLSSQCVDTTSGGGYADANSTLWFGNYTNSTLIANGLGGSTETLVDNSGGCFWPGGYCTSLNGPQNNDSGYTDDASNTMYYWSYPYAYLADGAGGIYLGSVTRPAGFTISNIYTYNGSSVYFTSDGYGGFILNNL